MGYAELLFSLQGRISRSTLLFKFTLPLMMISLAIQLTEITIGLARLGDPQQGTPIGVVSILFSLAMLYPSFAVSLKRCHDRGRSGAFLLLYLVPVVNLWPLIELYFLKGTTGPNEYGEDPLAEVGG